MKSCREISKLVSRSLDESLPFWSQVQIKMHFLMCQGCRRFNQQLKFVQHAVRKMCEVEVCLGSQEKLSQPGRERIQKTIDAAKWSYNEKMD